MFSILFSFFIFNNLYIDLFVFFLTMFGIVFFVYLNDYHLIKGFISVLYDYIRLPTSFILILLLLFVDLVSFSFFV